MAPSVIQDINTQTIDHFVYLTPPGSLEETSVEFRELGFHVLPGGTHSDGLTANALIILGDHAYIELISFTHPPEYYQEGTAIRLKRDSHPWSESFKKPGFVAFAFLGNGSLKTDESVSAAINQRAEAQGLPPLYASETPGGRTRTDGKELKWVISWPEKGGIADAQGVLPFFCGDITPRSLRSLFFSSYVPVTPSNTHHSSGTLAIHFLRLLVDPTVPSKGLSGTAAEIHAVLNKKPISSTSSELKWEIETPGKSGKGIFVVSLPQNDEELAYAKEHRGGVYEVGFWSKEGASRDSKSTKHGAKLSWASSTSES